MRLSSVRLGAGKGVTGGLSRRQKDWKKLLTMDIPCAAGEEKAASMPAVEEIHGEQADPSAAR
jgi:hypothetical protein